MDHWDLEFEQTLAESAALLKNTARSLDEDADYSLDSILAEFGGSPAEPAETAPEPGEQTLLEDAQEDAPSPSDGTDAEEDSPTGMSLQDVLAQTVQTVLNEQEHEPVIAVQPPRRGLFSRKKLQETEELYTRGDAAGDTEDEPEDESEPPERPIAETLSHYRTKLASARRASRAAAILAAVMWAALLPDFCGVMPACYTNEPLLQTLP